METFLSSVRERIHRRTGWRLAGVALLVGGGALLGLLLGAALFPSGIWRSLALTGAVVGGAALLLMRGRARRALREDAAVARLVRERLPGLGDDLWSALELSRDLPRLDKEQRLSGELVRALRANVSARVKEVDVARVVDVRPTKRLALRRIGVVGILWLVALTIRPSLLTRGWRELAKSRDERLTTSAEPIVGDVRVELIYPPYTGLPSRSIAGLSGQLLAMPGTVVQIEARALVPARSSAELIVNEDGKPPVNRPVEVKGQELKARFTVQRAGSFRFVLAGRVREPNEHRVEIDPDRPPRVDLYTPADPLEVAGPRRVELAYSVDDDYGLGDVELVWRVGEAPEAKKAVLPRQPGQRAASGKWEWDLGELDLQPGARVAYHLEAKDNDNVSGPNVGKSRTFYLFVSSPREKHEKSVANQEQLLEAAVTQLADRLELRDVMEGLPPIHNHLEAMLVLLTQAEQAADTDKPDGDAKKQLAEIHARLTKLVREEEGQLAEVRKRKPPKPHALEAGNAKLIVEMERDVLLLDDLLGKQRLEELLRVGDEMVQARDRLKQLLAEYKKTHSEALKKEIEREIRELERKLAELQKKAAKLASELPDQFLNRDAMGKNDLGSQLDKVRDLLARGDVDAAMAELEKLSSSLDKMMSSMEGDLRGYRRERFSEDEKRLAELEDKGDLEHDQKLLKNETDGIRQRTRAEAQRQMRDKVEPFQKKAREKVAQLRKHIDQIDKPTLSVWEQEELQRIKQRAADLDRLLEEADLDEARDAARAVEGALKSLGADLSDDESRAWRGAKPALKKSREHMEDGSKLGKQVADELDQLMPRPDQLMSQDDQRRMPEMAQRQRAARQRADQLQKEIDQMMKSGGKLPQKLPEGMRQAGEHMERAESKLRQHDARDAQGEEDQALQQLGQMKQQLQQERRPREQMAGGQHDKEPVKIPGADDYKAPKLFRQDLLEAMKRAAPAEYKDQVKRYYEELVKWRIWLLMLMSAAWAKSPMHAYQLINDSRVEEAEREVAELSKAHPHESEVLFLDGNIDFLRGRYERAADKLREAAARDPRPGPFGDELRGLRDLALATAEVTRGFVETRGKHFVIAHAPGKDAILVPYALEALDRAWETVGGDFGDRPEGLIRVEIYPEVADLAKVSTLTLQEIETSGTIALCKFNRLMIVSPRALLTGYPWLDTVTHEYTHFIVSRVSHNTVPIWLHEGLAKYEERRWHDKQGNGLTPMMEHMLATGLSKKHLITFAEMHPSMAKLPSQEDTALAFAEVYMVIEYLEQSIGWNGVRQIVARLREGKSVPEAVSAQYPGGKSFSEFQNEWRGWLAAQKLKLRPGLIPTQLRFKKGMDKPKNKSDENDELDLINEDKAKKFARLGGMLRARRRLSAAAQEYEKAQALIGPGNLQVANKLARTYLELGDPERAVKTAEPALELYPDQAAPAATLGEAWMKRGDQDRAAPYLERSIAVSPFDPAAHCALQIVYQRKNDPRATREEAACHALQ